ncbi:MAG: ATP-binding protein [Nanoarchaeota archaeon]
MEISPIIRDQKQELEERKLRLNVVPREAEEYFKNLLSSKLIKVILGVRRCGKSVLSHSLLKDKLFAYANFDDERLKGVEANSVLAAFYEVYGKEFKFIFLDEIQNLDNWELFANRLQRVGFNVIITGSNAQLLSKELATHLTGRHLPLELFPFSFKEYLTAVDFQEDIGTTKGISLLRQELSKYLSSGGFPEVIVEKENPSLYLQELYRKIIERDILERHEISYKKTFREIARTLISNPGRGISYNRIKNQFQLGSEHTVKNYLSYLEEAYLLFFLSRFSFKPVEVEKSEKKVYAIDAGMIRCMSLGMTPDLGQIYENTVYLELLRRKSLSPLSDIFYWKNILQEEVDFVIKENLKIKMLMQVCYNLSSPEVKEREVRALIKASKELKCETLLVITSDYEAEEKTGGAIIKFIPLWRWLVT